IAAVMLWDGVLTAGVADAWLYLPAVAIGALTGEAIWAGMWRGHLGGIGGDRGYWILAGGVPTAQVATYLVIMQALRGGIRWPTHVWAGAPFMGGLYGVVTSLFIVPPRFFRLSSRSES